MNLKEAELKQTEVELKQREVDQLLEMEKIKRTEKPEKKNRELERETIQLGKKKKRREENWRTEERSKPTRVFPKGFTSYIIGVDPQLFFTTFLKNQLSYGNYLRKII